jgi:hypothetical protein
MKENKCNVQFVCHGSGATCRYSTGINCTHCVDGNCHCADAMIGALEAEGFEVKE